MDLVLLFELFFILESLGQSNQIDIYLTSIVIRQKSTNQIAQYMGQSWHGFLHAVYISRSKDGRREHSQALRVIFGEYSHIVENGILTNAKITGRLQIFVLWGWLVCLYINNNNL